jgi:diguanylate cyclase (GGDEF)-like protein/PAS domain S-box-containing protein
MGSFARPAGAEVAGPPAVRTSRKGPIDQVRLLKRSVMIGVYGAIFGFIPFYAFVLHYTVEQLVIGTIIGLGIAVSAIEGAFGQMFRFRKRSSYPASILVEVGAASSTQQGYDIALDVATDVLALDWAAIAWSDGDTLEVVAMHGVPVEEAQRIFDDYAKDVRRAMREQTNVSLVNGKSCSVVAPLIASGHSVGAIIFTADCQTKELGDEELLVGMGVAAGVSLENLRQKEHLGDTLSVLSATLDSTADGILVVDSAGKIVSFNKRFQDIWKISEDVLRLPDNGTALQTAANQLVQPEEFMQRLSEIRLVPASSSFDTLQLRDGRVVERYSQPQIVEGAVVGRVWCFRDVTERKHSEETIRHLAYHDALTDLPNRALFADRLTVALAQARRTRQPVAVMFLDIDRFKLINDTLGHVVGDDLLKQVGSELSALVREGDTVARVGGDEFTLLLTGIDEDETVSMIARRILETVRQPRTLAEQELRVTTSLGVAMFPDDGETAESLLRHADTAMYRAKQQGRDNFQTYNPSMSLEIVNRVSLESDLRRSLERGEFELAYQPQVERGTWRITGVEALIRWRHPTKGMVHPAEFISVAEDTGLIVPIGEWVMREACRQAAAWQKQGLPPIITNVNLSALQFQQANLVEMIDEVLRETGLEPKYLEFEITEGTTVHDPDFAAMVLRQLRAMGVRISIDDFGTGYSSLNYLKRFRIDRLKIDRSFVDELTTDANDAAIATAVIVMAHSLGLGVVAEGVETEEQLRFLLERGCDEFQGYLIGRPCPEEEMRKMLEQSAETAARLKALAAPLLERAS